MVGVIPTKDALITLADLCEITGIKNAYLLRKKLLALGVKMLEIQKGKYLIDLNSLHQAVVRDQ